MKNVILSLLIRQVESHFFLKRKEKKLKPFYVIILKKINLLIRSFRQIIFRGVLVNFP